MVRPWRTAPTSVEKLSSSNTTSAACLATSVPDSPIATPMFACRSARASLMPSPVTATMRPEFFTRSMMRTLSSGATLLKTVPPGRACASASASGIGHRASTRVRCRFGAGDDGESVISRKTGLPSDRCGSEREITRHDIHLHPRRDHISHHFGHRGTDGSIIDTRPSTVRAFSITAMSPVVASAGVIDRRAKAR